MNLNEWVGSIKELTELEFQKAEEDAKELIKRRNGEQPRLEQFRNKVGGQFNYIFVLMVFAFIGALLVSTFDIAKFVGTQVALKESGDSTQIVTNDSLEGVENIVTYLGIPIDPQVKAIVFQTSFVLLAEFSVILFLIRWRQEVKTKEYEHLFFKGFTLHRNIVKFIMQFFNIYFWLATSSIGFVFYANWESGVHWLLAILPPIVTLGVGWVFEELITDWLAQKEKDTKQFIEANNEWLLFSREPETHKQYQEFLMRSIWSKLKSKNQRSDIVLDVDGTWKAAVVNRELKRNSWAKEEVVKKQFKYEHPELQEEKIKNMSNLEILRDKLDTWTKGDKPIIEIGEYVVDMKKLTLKNTVTNTVETANSLRGLKSKVTSKIKTGV